VATTDIQDMGETGTYDPSSRVEWEAADRKDLAYTDENVAY
jgi:hypothetical protein